MINLPYCASLLVLALYKKKRALVNASQRRRRGTLPGAKPGPVARIRVPIKPFLQDLTLFFSQCLFKASIWEQKRRLRSKNWDEKNKHKKQNRRKNRTDSEKVEERKQKLAWVKNNLERFKQSQQRVKRKNPIVGLLRNRVFCCIARGYKSASTLALLGCSVEQLKAHLEKQFKPGMSWKNRGKNGWEIDHIKPCAKFNLADPEQQKICFHYTNLQPLWAKDNLSKGAKYG